MRHLAALLLFLLVVATASGSSVEKTDSAALRSLQALTAKADAGDNNARFRLARALEIGYGSTLPRDSVRARRLFETAAAQGFAPAQNYLGFLLYAEQKPDSALHWMMQAADRADLTAYANIGWMLLNAKGVVRDVEKALYWLGKGSKAGSAPASVMLADIYRCGQDVPTDTLQAKRLYMVALRQFSQADYKQRSLVLQADSALSSLYPSMECLHTDTLLLQSRELMRLNADGTAIRMLCAAADRGNALALARLGKAYALGRGVPYNHLSSLICYARAAAAGNPSAQFIVGELLQLTPDALSQLPGTLSASLSLSNEMTQAEYWLEKAAEAGIKDAHAADSALQFPY